MQVMKRRLINFPIFIFFIQTSLQQFYSFACALSPAGHTVFRRVKVPAPAPGVAHTRRAEVDDAHDGQQQHQDPTVDGVRTEVMDPVAACEHGPQAYDDDGVNAEGVAEASGCEALQEEAGYSGHGDDGQHCAADHWVRHTTAVLENYTQAKDSVQERPPGECCQSILGLSPNRSKDIETWRHVDWELREEEESKKGPGRLSVCPL